MSVYNSMVTGKTFASHTEIKDCIKEIKTEVHVYLRRGLTQSISSFNNRKDVKIKLDPKFEFYRVQYLCPHSNKGSRLLSTTGERPNQNVMACNCPVEINFIFDNEEQKFKITKSVLEHNHPVSEQHVKTYARKKHMAPEVLQFAKEALAVGAQPTRLRGLLLNKHDTHLISKDLVNIKQSLSGNDADEWEKIVDILKELEDEIEEGGKCKNAVQVIQNADGEVSGIYFQTESQRRLYQKIGKIVEMDGTYGVTAVGFSLYHLLCEDNNGESQPIAQYFTKTETREDISEFLRLFSENNDVSVTKVTITDKDCNEIAALEKYFPGAEHILCLFHVFKAVDSRLNQKVGDKALTQTCKDDIRQRFRNAAYAETAADFEIEKTYLLTQGDGEGSLAAYFRDNWFTIESKWTKLARRHLPTFGNGTTNRLERFHHTIKDIFQKTKRLDSVIRLLLDNIKVRMNERRLKQKIRELRFPKKKTNPLHVKFKDSVTPFAWSLVEGQFAIIKKTKTTYDFILTNDEFNIQSRHRTYVMKSDLSRCSCEFFSSYELPCRHILFFLSQENEEIPTGIYSQHWLGGCREDEVTVEKSISPPIAVIKEKKIRRPVTAREQYNLALNLFKKIAETLSGMTACNFHEKLQLFLDIHNLIKKEEPIRLTSEAVPEKQCTQMDVSIILDSTGKLNDKKVPSSSTSHHPWSVLRLSRALKKRGRPKGKDKSLFKAFHERSKQRKLRSVRRNSLTNKRLRKSHSMNGSLGFVVEDMLAEEREMMNMEMDQEINSPIPFAFSPTPNPVDPAVEPQLPTDTNEDVTHAMESHTPSTIPGGERRDVAYDDDGVTPALEKVLTLPELRNHPMLFLDDVEQLTKNNKLRSGYINKAMLILQHQFPAIGGLFCCTRGGHLNFPKATGDQWMQIVHDGKDHWVLVAKGFFDPELVLVYDSMAGSKWNSQHIICCMSSLLRTPEKEMHYKVKACQRQGNGFDCGVFAIAFATSLANGEDPSKLSYLPNQLRNHLATCMEVNHLSPFPSTNSVANRGRRETIGKEPIYCSCRRSAHMVGGSQMVECEACLVWFHKTCVTDFPTSEESAWVCPKCKL